ncbi:hypothetical protein M9458_021570 [Cirrhinus mrigala]|uniref:Uncharacterized protein n=1 Tax=Cirrhinus mrigala TaxID=683832 RepID=A0ABD0Q7Y8_CIRMR
MIVLERSLPLSHITPPIPSSPSHLPSSRRAALCSGLSMQTMPGALGPLTIPSSAMTGRMTIHGMAPTAIHSVLLVSNLNPDVSFRPHPQHHCPMTQLMST